MARSAEETSQLLHPVGSTGDAKMSSCLLLFKEKPHFFRQLSFLSCNICIKSKAVALILVWSVVIGAVYLGLLSSFGILGFVLQNQEHHFHMYMPSGVKFVFPVYTVLAAYAFLALILLLYPVGGYIADIRYGRYKVVTLSFVLIWVAMLFLSAAGVIGISTNFPEKLSLTFAIPLIFCVLISLLLIIVSLACYQSNIIQLGTDQLFEASSEKLALFLHWLMWAYNLGSFLILLSIVFLPCYIEVKSTKSKLMDILVSVPFICLLLITLLMAFTCYNRKWFYSEPGQNYSPYKTVFRVLNFARKNKYPLQRSAFTYSDDFKPSRIDFAKERYGGPFTTPQVEDVKAFLRIVLVLLALGPAFVLEVPGSYYLFPLFALHVDDEIQFRKKERCHSLAKWILLQSKSLGYLASILFLPIYVWVVFSLLRKRIPKIFNRLWCAFIVSLSGIVSLLIVDLIGHIHYHQQQHFDHENSTDGTCLFTSHFLYSKVRDPSPVVLDLHWGVTVAPVVLLNIGPLLVYATTFEFISAQSPHAMKGLLVGVFFAIKGLFQFISSAAVVPFAIPNIWNNINSVTNCGFGYYLFTIVVALIGLIVFSMVAKSYKYRQRDERPFDTRFAEQYYERYIGTSPSSAASVCSPNDENMHEELLCTASSDATNSASK